MFREILPNLVAPIIVYASLLIPTNILFEAGALVPGCRRQAADRELGSDDRGRQRRTSQTVWWYMLFPGVALLLTVLAFNLVGDGLQDALNPKADR